MNGLAQSAGSERRARRERRREGGVFLRWERRTGFDRRGVYPITGVLRDSPYVLAGVLVATNVLSVLDFVLTYVELETGVASEGNAVMAWLFAQDPLVAWGFKAAAGVAAALVVWRFRRYRQILAVSVLAFLIYAAVIAYHLVGMRAAGLL